MRYMIKVGIRTIDTFVYLSMEVGGVENEDFLKIAAYNYVQKEKKTKIENGDTNAPMELFKER